MELSVNTKKKTALQKAIARNKKSVRIIMMISKVLLLVGIIGGGLYALLNGLMPGLSMVTVNGVSQKDIGWIIISTSFIVAPCLIFSVCLKALANNLASSNNSARVDESLLIADNKIRYSFRIKHQSTSSERRVITVDFSKIHNVTFDDATGILCFAGKILSEYFDDYRNKKPVNTTELDEFMICDYFTPSLKEALKSKGVSVNN